jgi:hypothetical protein
MNLQKHYNCYHFLAGRQGGGIAATTAELGLNGVRNTLRYRRYSYEPKEWRSASLPLARSRQLLRRDRW